MAKINEDMIVVKVSEMIRDDQQSTGPIDDDIVVQIEAIVQELVGANKIVEIIRS